MSFAFAVGSFFLPRKSYLYHSMWVWVCMLLNHKKLSCQKVCTNKKNSNITKFLFPEQDMLNVKKLSFYRIIYLRDWFNKVKKWTIKKEMPIKPLKDKRQNNTTFKFKIRWYLT